MTKKKIEEPIEEEVIEEPKEPVPAVHFVFDAAVINLWLAKAYRRRRGVFESVLITGEGIPEGQKNFVFELVKASLIPAGGTVYFPNDLDFAIGDDMYEVEEVGRFRGFGLRG